MVCGGEAHSTCASLLWSTLFPGHAAVRGTRALDSNAPNGSPKQTDARVKGTQPAKSDARAPAPCRTSLRRS